MLYTETISFSEIKFSCDKKAFPVHWIKTQADCAEIRVLQMQKK